MPLKIIRATEPLQVDTIILTVYAPPGTGKSSLAFTAHKPLLLDFDKGAYRAQNRGDSVPIATWSDVQNMAAEDIAEFSTIIIDTAGRALDALAQDIIVGNAKAGRPDGSLTLQGFGTLKSRFAQWQSFLRSLGKDIVLICHMDEQRNGDDTLERIDAQGASKNEIYKSSDAMCRIRIDGNDKRYLDFDPHQGGFGKNPAQLPKIAFPHPSQKADTLAEVIATIKGSINKITTAQAEAVKEAEAFQAAIAECDTLEKFNTAILPLMKERRGAYMALGVAEAVKRGYKANKTTALYEEALEAVPA